MKTHPLAEFWPLMDDAELTALAKDILNNGQLLPIFVDAEDRIVDGRNRYLACQQAGVQPIFEPVPEDVDIEAFVTSANEHRRHMTREKRNAVIKKLRAEGKSTREIAEKVGVSHNTVQSEIKKPESGTGRNLPVPETNSQPPTDEQSNPKPPPDPPTPAPPAPKRLTDKEKRAIWDRVQEGAKVAQVAREFGVQEKTVHRLIDKYSGEEEEKESKAEPAWDISEDIEACVKEIDAFISGHDHRWSKDDKAIFLAAIRAMIKDRIDANNC